MAISLPLNDTQAHVLAYLIHHAINHFDTEEVASALDSIGVHRVPNEDAFFDNVNAIEQMLYNRLSRERTT